jgi:hypothetical protein
MNFDYDINPNDYEPDEETAARLETFEDNLNDDKIKYPEEFFEKLN